jgi:hypothetical protein
MRRFHQQPDSELAMGLSLPLPFAGLVSAAAIMEIRGLGFAAIQIHVSVIITIVVRVHWRRAGSRAHVAARFPSSVKVFNIHVVPLSSVGARCLAGCEPFVYNVMVDNNGRRFQALQKIVVHHDVPSSIVNHIGSLRHNFFRINVICDSAVIIVAPNTVIVHGIRSIVTPAKSSIMIASTHNER